MTTKPNPVPILPPLPPDGAVLRRRAVAVRHVDEKVQVELASLQVSVGNGCNAKENDACDACDACDANNTRIKERRAERKERKRGPERQRYRAFYKHTRITCQ